MSKLDIEIPSQGFEIIRDRIGLILADEFAAQFAIHADSERNPKIFVERIQPIDKSEVPLLNVLYSRTNFDGNTAIDSDGMNTYHIDGYAKGKSSAGQKADNQAMSRLARILGMARAILESPHYLTLDFPKPFIMNTTVSEIQIADPRDNQDGANMMMGRLVFTVKAAEVTEPILATVAEGYDTQVKIAETDKGFVYVIDN